MIKKLVLGLKEAWEKRAIDKHADRLAKSWMNAICSAPPGGGEAAMEELKNKNEKVETLVTWTLLGPRVTTIRR